MKQLIDKKLTLFTTNTEIIKSGFTWQNTLTKRLAALLYTLDDKKVNCEAIQECHNIIKNNTGIFSTFRGNMSLCIAAMMSLRENRDQMFSNTMRVYNLLKTAKFHASDYLTVAAYLIAANKNSEYYQSTVERAKEFYDGMKQQRWFLTGQDDYIYAAMLGLSDIDTAAGIERVEHLYQRLKPEFWPGNSVQALSQVLVLGGKSDDTAYHLLTLRDTLRSRKIKLDKMYTLPALGVLALIPIDGAVLAQDILEAQSYLRAQKGFGSLSISTQELLLFSSAIISSVYAEEMKNNIVTSISTSIASIIIAQQVAIITAVSASTSAAASSSS